MGRPRMLAVLAGALAIVVATVAATAGSRPDPGVYAGLSTQGLPFKLTVAPDRATLTVDVRWRCTRAKPHPYEDDAFVVMFRRRSVEIAANGDFSWEGTEVEDLADDGDTAHRNLGFAGRHDGDGTISGTWSAESAVVNGQGGAVKSRCSSGEVAFDVRRRAAPAGVDDAGNRVAALDGKAVAVVVAAGRPWVFGGPARLGLTESDPLTGEAGARTSVGYAGPIAADADRIWLVTRSYADASTAFELTRFDARSRRVRRMQVVPPGRGSPVFGRTVQGIATGAGGVWLLAGDHVLRVEPRSGRVRSIRLTARPVVGAMRNCALGWSTGNNAQHDLIAVGAGAVWVISNCARRASRWGSLSRIDPRTNRVTRAVLLRREYVALTAGAGGVWAVATGAKASLHRIDLRTGGSGTVTRLPAGYVSDLESSREALWVAQGGEHRDGAPVGALRRLDPASGQLTTVADLEDPTSVAIGPQAVWVLDRFARTLTRIAR